MTFKVAIDAGHGINTSGKRTPDGEREWTFNDKVADSVWNELRTYEGVDLMRTDDTTGKTDVPLKDRTDKANKWGADVMVSCHHNGNTGKWGTWGGVETHVYETKPADSVKLAKAIQPKLVKAYGLTDRGIKYTDLHITRESHMTSVLVEGGFMDSKTDIKKLRDDAVLKKAGIAIATGIAEYGKLKKKPVVKPAAKPATSSAKTYTVKKGDTLSEISKDTGVSVPNLKSYNGLKSDLIHIGDVLNLSKTVTHKVVKNDTLWGLSQKYDVSVSSIKSKNGLKSDVLTIGDTLTIK